MPLLAVVVLALIISAGVFRLLEQSVQIRERPRALVTRRRKQPASKKLRASTIHRAQDGLNILHQRRGERVLAATGRTDLLQAEVTDGQGYD